MIVWIDHKEMEVKMNGELRQILAEESIGTHEFSICDFLPTDGICIANTKSIEHCCQKHVFSDERELAIPLHVRLCMLEIVVHF